METATSNLIMAITSIILTLLACIGFWMRLKSDQTKSRILTTSMKVLSLLVAAWAMAIIGHFWQDTGSLTRASVVSVVLAGYMLSTSFVTFTAIMFMEAMVKVMVRK